jgi:GNAT superfamily N-acetyltransferase
MSWKRHVSAILGWALRDEQRLAFYEWDFEREGRVERDPSVVEWTPEGSLPSAAWAQLFGGANPLSRRRMRWRWRRQQLRYFGLMIDRQLAAVAGIRAWSLHRREYGWLGRPGPILGPDLTLPSYRRQGLHRRMMLHRLHCCAATGADVAYTSAFIYNAASRRNIERVGFRPRGCMLIRRTCFRLFVQVRPLDDEPARVLTDADRPPSGG